MTTHKIIYEKEFFHFDQDKIVTGTNSRVLNPQNNTSLLIEIENSKSNLHKVLISKYDVEIFPMADPSDVFCNIKTKMIWDFEIEKNEDLGSLQVSEALLHNILNQMHFATILLRQNFIMDFATTAGLLHKANAAGIHRQIKEQLNFLADLHIGDSNPFLFSYWY